MKHFTIFLFLAVFSCNVVFSQEDTISRLIDNLLEEEKNTIFQPVFQPAENEVDSMIAFAKQFIGLKYRYGNDTPAGFDCSGFTGYIFSKFGYPRLGRSASDQYRDGILIERKDMLPGDLVFFREQNRNGSYRISHVGMVVSVDSANSTFHFIHSCRRGVLIDHSTMEYYYKRYYGVRRIVGVVKKRGEE